MTNIPFTSSLMQTLIKPNVNVCFSPVGVSDTLRALKVGARDVSEAEITRLLSSIERLHPPSSCSNISVCVDHKHQPVFPGIHSIPFLGQFVTNKTVYKIVNHATKGNIQPNFEILPDCDVLVVNACFPDEQWAVPFSQVSPLQKTSDVEMMSVCGVFNIGYIYKGVRMVELPYKSHERSMYVILPDEPTEALPDINNLISWITKLNPTRVLVSIPKFTNETYVDVNALFDDLNVFDSTSSNVSGFTMSDHPATVVAKQLTKFSMSKLGSTGHMPTKFNFKFQTSKTTEVEFVACRPFIYLVFDKLRQEVLFIGQQCI